MTLSLAQIPSEVVQEIAINLEVDGCLALAQTSQSLRRATLDALLLQKVIGSQHTLWNFHSLNLIRIAQRLKYDAHILQRYQFFALDQQRIGHWDKLAFNQAITNHFGLDISVWARYAVADLRAFRLCTELNSQIDDDGRGRFGFVSNESFNKTMAYLPHILVLKHPSIHASGLAPALATQLFDLTQSPVPTPIPDGLAFSYCATMLSQDTPEAPLFGSSNPRAAQNAFFKSCCKAFAHRLKAASELPISPYNAHQVPRQRTRMTQSEALVIIGAFSSLLRRAFREYRVRRLIGADYYTFILPFALDVPMNHSTEPVKPPVPFQDDQPAAPTGGNWDTWYTTHIHTMTSYSFLQEGQWVGCYSYTYPNTPEIDAPMMDIAFDFTSGGPVAADKGGDGEADGEHGATAVHATGTDSIGAFTLEGYVERTGHVQLRKTYENGKRWDWNCAMTAFGIGGVWGPCESEVVNGSVWLWKKGWTQGRK